MSPRAHGPVEREKEFARERRLGCTLKDDECDDGDTDDGKDDDGGDDSVTP